MTLASATVVVVGISNTDCRVIGNRHRLMAASCPAFEGGEVLYGMPGYDGAIESIQIVNDQVRHKTIGDQEPQGICGSGLVDLLAQLRQA